MLGRSGYNYSYGTYKSIYNYSWTSKQGLEGFKEPCLRSMEVPTSTVLSCKWLLLDARGTD